MIDRNALLQWLKEIDGKLKGRTTVVAVGGTAMTLLGLKPSTIDIDLCVTTKERPQLESATGKKFKVDIFTDGYILSEQLPDDYSEKAKEILTLKNLVVKALSPVDIIITKAARLNARDEEDIKSLVKFVAKEELMERFSQVVGTYAGHEEQYRYHMEVILKRFYSQP